MFLVSVDATVLFAAFAALRRSFEGSSAAALSWVLNTHTVVYAALLAHSADDPIVPQAGLARVAQVWPGAQWWPLDGLGHFKVLSDAGVLQRIVVFARSVEPQR